MDGAVPFVRLFYGSPSTFMWKDAEGVEHLIPQGEGGEQGDPMMPLLYSLGQHSALEAAQEELREDEVVCAFLDDIYVVTPDPHRIGPIYTTLQQHLYSYARIRVHGGKTQVWNRAGIRPRGCDAMERIAQLSDNDARA